MIFYLLVLPLSLFLTLLVQIYAKRRSIVDIPNIRSLHIAPIPRGGGIAIIMTFYLGIFCLYLLDRISRELFLALLPGLIIAILGIFDDILSLPVKLRFTIQAICSLISLLILQGFHPLFDTNLSLLWPIIALFGMVWFINLFNFLDGSDGYAAMEAVSIGIAIWFFTGMNVLLLLAFSVLGFLYWNWPKAKIFMGDSGSTTLGFILVVFGIYFHNSHQLHFALWLILTSLFWFDATFTLFRRILNKEKLSQAHKKHIYQRAIQGGFSHLKTMLSGLAINILLFCICLAIREDFIPMYLGFILALCILVLAMHYVDKRFAYRK